MIDDLSEPWNILKGFMGIPRPVPSLPPMPDIGPSPFPPNITGGMLLAIPVPQNGLPSPAPPGYPSRYAPNVTGMPPAQPFDNRATGTINDPRVGMPSDNSLNFDPNSPGEWGAAMRHPLDAITANNLADQAYTETKRQYPNDPEPHNDQADAFRHAYWNYLMARAFGAQEAQLFGNAHEISKPDPSGERYMDLYNNQVGRNLATSGGDANATDAIQQAIKKGSLRLSPF
jgi:hypothetical protein